MAHRWSEDDDAMLLGVADELENKGMPRGTLWAAVSGIMLKELGVSVTPAACYSRHYRLARVEPEAREALYTVQEAVKDDAWAAAEEMVQRYEADILERIELQGDRLEILVRSLLDAVTGLRESVAKLEEMWR